MSEPHLLEEQRRCWQRGERVLVETLLENHPALRDDSEAVLDLIYNELQRFLYEAETLASLQHPNVVQVFDSGQHHGLPYFALEFVSGGSLADLIRDNTLAPRQAAELVWKIAQGVQAAHEKGIVHRD